MINGDVVLDLYKKKIVWDELIFEVLLIVGKFFSKTNKDYIFLDEKVILYILDLDVNVEFGGKNDIIK